MNYHNITKCDMANGSGIRTVLWVAGCNHQCPGCHNEMTWDCNGGIPFDGEAIAEIFFELGKPECDGITFSGGDPLHPNNRKEVLKLAENIKNTFGDTKTCWLYTGFLWEDIRGLEGIENIDVLIDGRYVASLGNPSPKWRGSTNQRIIDVKKSLRMGEVVLYEE